MCFYFLLLLQDFVVTVSTLCKLLCKDIEKKLLHFSFIFCCNAVSKMKRSYTYHIINMYVKIIIQTLNVCLQNENCWQCCGERHVYSVLLVRLTVWISFYLGNAEKF